MYTDNVFLLLLLSLLSSLSSSSSSSNLIHYLYRFKTLLRIVKNVSVIFNLSQ